MNKFNLNKFATYIFLLAALAACRDGDAKMKVVTVPAAEIAAPQALITTPVSGASRVALNRAPSATFSDAIPPAIRTTGIQNAAGNTLCRNFCWSFAAPATARFNSPVRRRVEPLVGPVVQEAGDTGSAAFNKHLNCTRLSADCFHVLEAAGAVHGFAECSGNSISFKSAGGSSIHSNTVLRASLTAVIKYLADTPISAYALPFGTEGVDSAKAIASDAAGNVYAAGYTSLKFFSGAGLAGPGSAGSAELFISKYDASGGKRWSRQLGAAGDNSATAIASDAAGNAYVAGSTRGVLDGQTSAGGADVFIGKYDARGVKQWMRQLGTAGSDIAYAITSDAAGSVYAAGYTSGALDDQSSAGGYDAFIAKYDAKGGKQWTRQLGTAGSDYAKAITSDAAGYVYVAGYTNGALHGQRSAGGYDLFIAKYDASGVKQWTRQLGTAGVDTAYAVTSDAAGNVYAAGYTSGALDGQRSAGGADLFIVKYDAGGVKQWTRQLGTAGYDTAQAITSDAAGNVYATGYTSGALDGQSSAGGADLFITKFDASGKKQWTRQLGTAGYDTAQAISSDAAGNVYAAGYTSDVLDGQPRAGDADLFSVQYQSDGF